MISIEGNVITTNKSGKFPYALLCTYNMDFFKNWVVIARVPPIHPGINLELIGICNSRQLNCENGMVFTKRTQKSAKDISNSNAKMDGNSIEINAKC